MICGIVGKIAVSWKGPNCWRVKRKGNREKTALGLKSTKDLMATVIVASPPVTEGQKVSRSCLHYISAFLACASSGDLLADFPPGGQGELCAGQPWLGAAAASRSLGCLLTHANLYKPNLVLNREEFLF